MIKPNEIIMNQNYFKETTFNVLNYIYNYI